MKSRTTLLAFALLLLTGSLLCATEVLSAPVLKAPAPDLAIFTPPPTGAEASPCPGNASSAEAAIFAPASSPKSSSWDYCGMCGTDPCRGVLRGTICGIDYAAGRYKRCEMLYGDQCPGEESVVCYCYSGDIP